MSKYVDYLINELGWDEETAKEYVKWLKQRELLGKED